MRKKEDVIIFFDSPSEFSKINKEILSFGEISFEVVRRPQEHIGFIYFNKQSGNTLKEPVSLQELKNILAFEYLRTGDVCLFDDRKVFKSIGVFDKYSEEYKDFLVSKVPGKDSVRYGFHDFIRYATEEEKQLLKPQESVIEKAISLLQHGLGLDYSHEVIKGLEELKNK